jgi:hypothetical protein
MPLPSRHLFTHLTLHLGLQRQLEATRGPFLPSSLLFSAARGHLGQELSFQPLCQDLWVESKCAIYPKCTRNPPRSPCLVDVLRGHAQEPCEFGTLTASLRFSSVSMICIFFLSHATAFIESRQFEIGVLWHNLKLLL